MEKERGSMRKGENKKWMRRKIIARHTAKQEMGTRLNEGADAKGRRFWRPSWRMA